MIIQGTRQHKMTPLQNVALSYFIIQTQLTLIVMILVEKVAKDSIDFHPISKE